MARRPALLLGGLGLCWAGCGRAPAPAPVPADPIASLEAKSDSRGSDRAPPAAGPPVARSKIDMSASAMGTRLEFVALTSEAVGEAATRSAIDRAIAEVRRLEALMTTWTEDSEVSRVNRAAGVAPVPVGPDTLAVIEKSLWISAASGGVFDITFEAMHGLWKFDEDMDSHLPSAELLAERRKLIDYRQIAIDRVKSTVFLQKPKMKMGLGGIAKGYAIDRAADILAAAGIRDFLAQAGGDLYLHGHKADGSPWVAGVRDPRGADGSYFATLPVIDHAFSTAGDYERSYVVGGKRYHHILDPRTGYPATASRSVTVWANDALTADALDDAVFILGPEKGLALIESVDDAGAVIVDAQNHVWISKRLEGKVNLLKQPTDGI